MQALTAIFFVEAVRGSTLREKEVKQKQKSERNGKVSGSHAHDVQLTSMMTRMLASSISPGK